MPVSGNDIVIKLFRLHVEGTDGVKNFAKELRVTSRLKHPNVLTPLGYVSREGGGSEEYYIVSEFMPRGSLRFCMAELSMRERYSMSLGIAEGIRYLHDNDVVHGDIKTLSPSGVPLLSDFGVSRVKESFVSKGYYSTATPRASMRWLASEYFNHPDAEEFHFTTKTDVWAFGMTLLELLTGELPYSHIRSDSRVVTEIVMGRLPHKPTIENNDIDAELKRFMWSICLKCWIRKPEDRPPIDVVSKEMNLQKVS
ncbi:kinase-like protein [Schizopora paradoxa]|uniref:Kinase-like protein n=1 Tax=Schizopora paradoxa TaxID=27342 RepID=A0A0H2RYN3_9AGAM|nr:kinase-like protein [Schizopora paradoxa]